MKTQAGAIGVFDSGIGGLTVASAIHKLLPHESIIYFGDTAHVPYGDKSPALIQRYVAGITRFLLEKKVKMVVIACNTASSFAFDICKELCGTHVPVINVIDPTVDYILELQSIGKIGVIGTKGTVKSGIYAKKIKAKSSMVKVEEVATPLLAPMIEEGFFNNKISQTIVNSYLAHRRLKGIKSLILGCTHYPLIIPEIKKFYQGKVEVVDSAATVAKTVKQVLKDRSIMAEEKPDVRLHFYVSDFTAAFQQSTAVFFGDKVKLEKADIWKAGV
jgi:glutamate racemase